MTDRFAIRAFQRPLRPRRRAGPRAGASRSDDGHVRERADLVELIEARTGPGARAARSSTAPLPVPRGAHGVVLGQPRGQALLLLRLPARAATSSRSCRSRGPHLQRGASRGWPSATASRSSTSRRARQAQRARDEARRREALLADARPSTRACWPRARRPRRRARTSTAAARRRDGRALRRSASPRRSGTACAARDAEGLPRAGARGALAWPPRPARPDRRLPRPR